MKVYTQNKYEADAILSKVIVAFEQYKVVPTPLNFLVWYEYFLGTETALVEMLDSAIANRDGYTNTLGVRIYEAFLKEQQVNTSELEQAFRKFLERMISKLMDWTTSMEQHTSTLNTYVNQLSDNDNIDPETLKSLTGSVLSTTRSIVASQTELQQEMVVATLKIQELQKELLIARAESMTDPLTQLPNRRAFTDALEQAMASTKQSNDLSIILFDIDHFKKFNDTYGHLIGDAVLRFIAGIVQKVVEPSQLIARIGGEEFAILIPHASIEQASTLAETIRTKVASSQLKRKDTGETINNIHISLGVASYRPNEEWDSLYQRADDALYQSKKQGRNRTTVAAV
jgi:diguanylate cyclase